MIDSSEPALVRTAFELLHNGSSCAKGARLRIRICAYDVLVHPTKHGGRPARALQPSVDAATVLLRVLAGLLKAKITPDDTTLLW